MVGNNQIGLIWTEGKSLYDVMVYSFAASPDVKAPAVSMTTPLDGATVSGTIPVSAGASDNAGVAGVQFRLDGADLGAEVTAAPYTTQWNTATAANGAHVLTAIARDEAGNTATAAEVSVTVANIQTPIITWPTPQKIGRGNTTRSNTIECAGEYDRHVRVYAAGWHRAAHWPGPGSLGAVHAN